MNRKLVAVSLFFSFGLASTAIAKSDLTISEAKILIPLKGTTVTAGYGVLRNDSDQPAILKIKSIKPFKAVELYETFEADGKMGMRKVEQIVVPAHKTFEFKPGAHHIMLFEPTKVVKLNEQLVGEFDQDGKTVTFKFRVSDRKAHSSNKHSHD